MDRDLFDSMSVDRLLPIYRNPNSYFVPDQYQAGIRPRTAQYEQSRTHLNRSAMQSTLGAHDAYRSNLRDMDDRMRDMQRNMDAMYRGINTYQEPMSLMPLMPSRGTSALVGAGAGAGGSEITKFQIENPVIKDVDGKKKLHLEFDVHHFKSDEISVKTKDRFLEIHAKHEEKSETGTAYREYRRVFNVPNEVDPEALRSELSPDGILTIEADVQGAIQAANEPKKIAITHE